MAGSEIPIWDGWDGHTLFLGCSLLLNVWPKRIVTYSLFHLENF